VRSQFVGLKAAVFILVVTLAFTAKSEAQSSINITGGTFIEIAGAFGQNDSFSFQFVAPNSSSQVPYVFVGDTTDPVAGFQSCTQSSCTLTTIKQIGKSVPLQIAAPGGLFGLGGSPAYCWSGGGTFTYSSGFSSSMNAGVLTVQGNVTPSLSFTPGDISTCNPNGLPQFVVTGTWHYTAQFNHQSAGWYLTQMQINPVP
jgi:hypothetical protein